MECKFDREKCLRRRKKIRVIAYLYIVSCLKKEIDLRWRIFKISLSINYEVSQANYDIHTHKLCKNPKDNRVTFKHNEQCPSPYIILSDTGHTVCVINDELGPHG